MTVAVPSAAPTSGSAPEHDTRAAVNKVQSSDRAAHDWYRFVLSYPPHLVRDYLERFDAVSPKDLTLDPFCGTGTTLVECKKLGVPSAGVEANPMAAFASDVKTRWGADPEELRAWAEGVAGAARRQFRREGLPDGEHSFAPAAGTRAELRGLSPEGERLILTDSISPAPLHKSLVLLEKMERARSKEGDGGAYLDYGRLALAKALAGPIGNLHFGPEVGIGKIKADAPVVDSWLEVIAAMAADLAELKPLAKTPAQVHPADSRAGFAMLKPRSVSAVITSPPYPNEKDYTRTTRLESVLLGFLKDKKELRRFKEGLLRSNTRNVFKADTDDAWIKDEPEIQALAREIEQRRLDLGKTSGFEKLYARVTLLYFGGMVRHLKALKPVLRPGAKLAYVVGDQASFFRIMIRTGQILGGIAERLGYRVNGIDLFRTRHATATRAQLREEVVLLEWPGREVTTG